MTGLDENRSSKITDMFKNSIIQKHDDIIIKCREKLYNVIKNEIREIMRQGLFRSSWENDVAVIITLQNLLEKYDHGKPSMSFLY